MASVKSAMALSYSPLMSQMPPRVIVGIGVLGVEPDGLVEVGDGLVELPCSSRQAARRWRV